MKKTCAVCALFAAAFFTVSVVISCKSVPLPEPPEVSVCSPEAEPFEPNEFELRVFELTNVERSRQRLPPFEWNNAASCVARQHSIDMQSNDFMRQRGSDGSDSMQRLERAGIGNIRRRETNIAGGWLTPEEVVAAWMESPIHKPNILSREFTHVGVGFFPRPDDSESRYATYWTQEFLAFD
ncbi:MAG: CAP domain-containing protein [Treponema sp.]|nr:CAP domain-containing protein [Treponema sp.]